MRHLRRKLTLRAHGEQVVFVKREHERIEHVWMKAFLWALYLPSYRDLSVEVAIDDKYKPDVVALDRRRGRPQFWGEAGHVGPDKTKSPYQNRLREARASEWSAPKARETVPKAFGKRYGDAAQHWKRAAQPLAARMWFC